MSPSELALFLLSFLSSLAFLFALRWGRRQEERADFNAAALERILPLASAELARRHKLLTVGDER